MTCASCPQELCSLSFVLLLRRSSSSAGLRCTLTLQLVRNTAGNGNSPREFLLKPTNIKYANWLFMED